MLDTGEIKMRYKKIPKTDMEISVISIGTWVFGGKNWGMVDDEESILTIRAAVDCGINFIDTAPIYGRGRSEQVVGKAINGIRNKFYVATKCGIQVTSGGFSFNLRPKTIIKELEDSLKRLKIETVDIYQCHYPDPNTPIEDSLAQMLKLKKQGKIRYIGVSNFDLSLLEEASQVTSIVSLQPQYSLLNRGIEKNILPFCQKQDIGVFAYGPLGSGILTGKYVSPPEFPRDDARSFFYPYYKQPYWGKIQGLITEIKNIAQKRKRNPAEVALNWVNQQQDISTALVGCRNRKQLQINASAGDWMLTPEELRMLASYYNPS